MGCELSKVRRVRKNQKEGEKEILGRLEEKQETSFYLGNQGQRVFQEEGGVLWQTLLMEGEKAEN